MAFVLLLVVVGLLRQPLVDLAKRGWAQFSGRAQQEALAKDLLVDARFRSLQPGTSAEEVRNRVGLPWARANTAPLDKQESWYYATEANRLGQRKRFYIVTMNGGKVAYAMDITDIGFQFSVSDLQIDHPRYLGDLNVYSKGNKSHVLRAATETATVLIGPSAGTPLPEDFPFHTLRPDRLASTKTGETINMPPLSLYWRGVLYALPASREGVPASVLADDLKWLFQRLSCDESGAAVAPAKRGHVRSR